MYMFLHPLKPTEDLEFRILYCLSENEIDVTDYFHIDLNITYHGVLAKSIKF